MENYNWFIRGSSFSGVGDFRYREYPTQLANQTIFFQVSHVGGGLR